jgi:DNA-binding HxlR family transcriptional regulator
VESQKETKLHGKWYGDACGGAYAFELLGERWSALVVRELMFGGKRFNDIRAGLPGISAKALTDRLGGLEATRIVRRRLLPPPANIQVYELTEWGMRCDEGLLALCRWSLASPDWDRSLPVSSAAFLMSMRALFDPQAAGNLTLDATLWIGIESFRLNVSGARFRAERGGAESPDFSIMAPDTGPLKRLFYGKALPERLADAGLELAGNHKLAASFIDLFHLPAAEI